jgi:protein-disulfide isomerase
LVILGVLAVVAVIGAAGYERFAKPKVAPAIDPATGQTATATIPLKPDDMVLGSPDAKVTIVEYASLTCPHCAAFHNNTLPMIKERYIDKGLVKLVYRDFPLDGLALRAAYLPHCAGPMRYFGLLGTLFARQSSWVSGGEQTAALAALGKIASQAGMSEEAFQACLADKAMEKKVLDSAMEAQNTFQVKSTPTLFVNGVKYVGGLTPEQARAVLDPLTGLGK